MNPAAFEAKQKNARRIVDYIVSHGETSRVALANIFGLSTATVTNIVTELLDQKLLYESRREQSIAGRKATLLQFNSNLHYALTVSIGRSPKDEDCAEFTICNLRGEIISEKKMYQAFTISESFSESDMLKGLIAALRAFIAEQSSSTQAALCAIGICIHGMVNCHQTVDTPILNWKNVNLTIPLQAALHLPVYVEGVTRVKALYELRFIDLQEKNVLYLNLSSGVGAVNFFNGKMVVGRTGIAGEVGHITLNLHGPRCYCGNRGCFELYCGMNNIIVYAERLLTAENANDVFFDMAIQQHRPLTPELIFEAREEGSLIIHELLCNTAAYLGAGIASLFNIYDFDRMIISGYLDNGKDDFLINRAIEYAKGWIINPYSRDLIVSRAHLNSNQLYLALSALVLKHLLDDTFHT